MKKTTSNCILMYTGIFLYIELIDWIQTCPPIIIHFITLTVVTVYSNSNSKDSVELKVSPVLASQGSLLRSMGHDGVSNMS